MRPGNKSMTLQIRADQRSTALLIGHQGRMARPIRAIMEAIGNQDGWHCHLMIEESAGQSQRLPSAVNFGT